MQAIDDTGDAWANESLRRSWGLRVARCARAHHRWLGMHLVRSGGSTEKTVRRHPAETGVRPGTPLRWVNETLRKQASPEPAEVEITPRIAEAFDRLSERRGRTQMQ
jgi:hypothetical protein